jgi:hypothetical protein
MTMISGRYQPLESARPGAPQRARDLQTAQTVVLREVELPPTGGDAALAWAQAAKGIFHPSLVVLFDVVPIADRRLLLAYEFVTAQPLVQVTSGHPLPVRRAAEIVAEIADAAAELHARDLSHGAIAQPTILITMKGKAKLDRVGDPSLERADASVSGDLAALGDLLDALVGRAGPGGVAGAQAIATLVDRARRGRFESAAAFAALLRRV